MLASLIASLNSLRDFFTKNFFLAAFLPTLIFVFVNAIIGFMWSWTVHDWIESQWLKGSTANVAILFTIVFLCLWIWSYITAALTSAGIRILEGAHWPNWLSERGRNQHIARYDKINDAIEEAVRIYVDIDQNFDGWRRDIEKANLQLKQRDVAAPDRTIEILKELKTAKIANKLIAVDKLQQLINNCISDIKEGKTRGLETHFDDITLVIEYAKGRAEKEQLRLLNERNSEFGYREDIAPTRFGNVGHLADAFAERAFGCNLALVWNPLRRAAERDGNTAKSLEDCKSQLDFFVACFWFSLILAFVWAWMFAFNGEILGTVLAASVGPFVCFIWYSAAVEQYRSLQGLVISSLNGSLRFQMISDLRFAIPADIAEERDLWRMINLVIGNGDDKNLRYQAQSSKP